MQKIIQLANIIQTRTKHKHGERNSGKTVHTQILYEALQQPASDYHGRWYVYFVLQGARKKLRIK